MVFDGGLKISGGKDKGRRDHGRGSNTCLSPHGSRLSRSSGPRSLLQRRLSATDEDSEGRLQDPGSLGHSGRLYLSSDLLNDESIFSASAMLLSPNESHRIMLNY